MASYEEDLPLRVPPWFGADGRAHMAALGIRLDALHELFTAAVHARLPGAGPDDALEVIGQDRGLPQGPSETDLAYAARLKDAWDIWGGDDTPVTGVGGGAGSPLGMLNALKAAGLPTGPTGATIVQQNGRSSGTANKKRGYAQLDNSGNLVLGELMPCNTRTDLTGAVNPRPGWTVTVNDNFYSIFGIVFPATATIDVGLINSIAIKWRPSKAVFYGTWVISVGRAWGWPTTGTWGSGNWGGNTVTFYPGPNGEATLMGFIP